MRRLRVQGERATGPRGEILKGPRNLEAATRLLTESGYVGEPVTSMAAQDLAAHKAWGDVTADLLTRLGIKVEIADDQHVPLHSRCAKLKRLAGNLPAIPFDLTAKNKSVLRQLESERVRAKLLFLPQQLLAKVAKDLENGRVRFVDAQVAIAIDILLALPLRPQNLSSLSWRHNFSEPNGPRGQLLLHIGASDTKTKKQDIVSEVPDEVARHLRWYRRHVLPALGADMNGHLFVTKGGSRKEQPTLTIQIMDRIARHIGIHMTPHQFRHFGATSYLEQHPEDFETARAILGHAWSKTTRIYAGSSSRRASRAYNQYLVRQREALKLLGRKRVRGG
jgi:integrase